MEWSITKENVPIYRCTEKNQIASCSSIVDDGGVIIFPTDTVYGIGCSPYNYAAVERVFEIKGRDKARPLPILAASINDIERIVSLGKIGRKLATIFWPGGLTLISILVDSNICKNVTAGQPTVGVRIPNNLCVIELLKECKYLVGTSANVSGETSNLSVSEVVASSLRGFDAILDGGITKEGKESTVIEVSGEVPQIIREGTVPVDLIKQAISIASD